jgi:hypothetical protein
VLLAPIASRLGDHDRFLVLPDDLLWKVPIEALIAGDRDLASRGRVTYATSLVTLALQYAAQTDAVEHAAPRTFGGVAAPEIGESLRAQLSVTAPDWAVPDPTAAVESTRRFAGFYAGAARVVTGAEAVEAAVTALADTVDVLHVAAPFQISAASPLFSSVLLAARDEVPGAGRWELREWFRERGRARTIVLPDGAWLGGAGAGPVFDALAWCAAASGASRVVLGRWPPAGFATDAVLSAWHERFAKPDADASSALRDAIASVRADSGDAPASWAGIRLIGADR